MDAGFFDAEFIRNILIAKGVETARLNKVFTHVENSFRRVTARFYGFLVHQSIYNLFPTSHSLPILQHAENGQGKNHLADPPGSKRQRTQNRDAGCLNNEMGQAGKEISSRRTRRQSA